MASLTRLVFQKSGSRLALQTATHRSVRHQVGAQQHAVPLELEALRGVDAAGLAEAAFVGGPQSRGRGVADRAVALEGPGRNQWPIWASGTSEPSSHGSLQVQQ